MTLELSPQLVVGFLFALVRTSAWIIIAPPFNSSAIPSRVKLVISVGIALVLAPSLGHHPELYEIGPFVTSLAYQAFVGVALGFVVLLLFSAVQAAGELIDLFSGFSAASLYDPFSNAASSPMGRLYQMVAVVVLFAINGHLMLVRGFMESFQAAPLSGPRLDDLSRLITHDLSQFMLAALQIAAPMLAALFLTELALGLLGKAAPQTNILQVGFAVKIFLVLAMGGIALPLLPGHVSELVLDVVRSGTRLVGGDAVSGSDKTEKPTPKRKRENRKKGHVAKSPELVSWAMVLTATILLPSTFGRGEAAVLEMLAGFQRATEDPEPGRMLIELQSAFVAFVELLIPLFIGLCVMAVVGQLAQTGLVFSTTPLKPSLKRLNPLQGVKRMFSAKSMFEVVKQVVRLVVVAVVAWPVVESTIEELSGRSMPLFAEVSVVGGAAVRLVRNVAVAALVVAVGDYVFQRKQHNKQTRMSKQDIRDEHKSSEGNAEVKGKIRSLQVAASRNRMLAAVGDANVVVVNPVHIAVALRYDPTRGAPRVVARGAGAVAERIRNEADRAGVPIVESIPLARALHKACELDDEIPMELYEGVARVLAFVQRLAGRAPLGGGYHRLGGTPIVV